MGLDIVDWIYLAEDRSKRLAVVNSVTNVPVKLNVGNFLTIR